jgi:hypothetical protein
MMEASAWLSALVNASRSSLKLDRDTPETTYTPTKLNYVREGANYAWSGSHLFNRKEDGIDNSACYCKKGSGDDEHQGAVHIDNKILARCNRILELNWESFEDPRTAAAKTKRPLTCSQTTRVSSVDANTSEKYE